MNRSITWTDHFCASSTSHTDGVQQFAIQFNIKNVTDVN